MVETELLRRVRYNESLRSGSDYNLGLRLLRSGADFLHTGEFHTLRRLHPRQITETDSSVQKTSAVLTSFMARVPMSAANMDRLRAAQKEVKSPTVRGSKDVLGLVGQYFPDHLVRRSASVTVDPKSPRIVEQRAWLVRNASRYVRVEKANGEVEVETAQCSNVSLADLAGLRAAGLDFELLIQSTGPDPSNGRADVEPAAGAGSMMRGLASKLHADNQRADQPYLLVVTTDDSFDLGEAVLSDGAQHLSRLVTDGSSSNVLHLVSGLPLDQLGQLRSRLARRSDVAYVGVGVPAEHLGQDEAVAMLARTAKDDK